ncbi:MAG: hypothetical protein EZS28_041166 [Streblomastix strix]|uniref:Tyr recombinase domain-containing protein n=1 Tax=Streblomastix strix TaxID=222440 RepID=A0A5J4TYH9_9EUKA|nr:MAG: hypothetical protein EZS28_041166 [Streblomastix strix]
MHSKTNISFRPSSSKHPKELQSSGSAALLIIGYVHQNSLSHDSLARQPNIPNKPQKLWRISYDVKYIQVDDLNKAISAIIQAAGIDKTYSVTCISAAAITKLLKRKVKGVQIDRLAHHSDTTSMVRRQYDKKINIEIRKVYNLIKEKLDNEEVEEQERILLEELNIRDSMSIREYKPKMVFFLQA